MYIYSRNCKKMIHFARNFDIRAIRCVEKQLTVAYSNAPQGRHDEFRALNLKYVKQTQTRRPLKKVTEIQPRTERMATDQDWGSVWPGARSFHPATVPLPVRQGYTVKGAPPPGKFANAELMKIPNFLHLTPPVIKRQCEALKRFCTPWPKSLANEETIEKHFPLDIVTSNYCHSSPTIRDPLARIVTVRFKLSCLGLDARAKDKFLRLVGDRYCEETDQVTIVTDRCPLKKQNYDYALYLVTALYHESRHVEEWEKLKSEADMERYIWENNVSKQSIEQLFGSKSEEIPNVNVYSDAISNYMNEGENDYTIGKYQEAVRKIFNLPSLSSKTEKLE